MEANESYLRRPPFDGAASAPLTTPAAWRGPIGALAHRDRPQGWAPSDHGRRIRQDAWKAALWLRLGWVLVAAQAMACGLLVEAQGWIGAPALALFAVVSAAGLRWSPPLPASFACLFAAASVINAAGWIWSLFDRFEWYDDILHVMTPFALVGALFVAALRLGWIRRPRTAVRAAALGAAAGLPIGLAWEGLEAIFAAFPLSDTLMDLAYDMAGAGLASWLVWRAQPPAVSRPAGDRRSCGSAHRPFPTP